MYQRKIDKIFKNSQLINRKKITNKNIRYIEKFIDHSWSFLSKFDIINNKNSKFNV